MISLKASNKILLQSAKYSYLNSNYLSGVTSLVISNSDGFQPYVIGSSDTQFDITNPSGTTFRYTYDSTGTDPEIGENIQVNTQVVIAAANFNAGNNGTFTVTAFDQDANWFEVTNASGVAENNVTIGGGSITVGRTNFVLLGEFGSESSEIVEVSSVNKSTHTLTVGATKFAHSVDTKVYIIGYDKAKFYHTSTATFSATDPITGYIDIQADSLYTVAGDTVNTSGFGHYIFYNSITAKASSSSNPIPYDSFGDESVSSILASFYSLLNQSERKLITDTDAMTWLNAGYSEMRNQLNLVARDYFANTTQTVTTVSGTAETALNTAFSYIISVYDETNEKNVDSIQTSNISSYNYNTGSTAEYYIRHDGSAFYIGFSPIPTSAIEYTVRYAFKTAKLTSYYDNVVIPGNGHYKLVDYMLYRAAPKIGRPDGQKFLDAFNASIANMKIMFHSVNGAKDSFSIEHSANV